MAMKTKAMAKINKAQIDLLKTFIDRFNLDIVQDGMSVTFDNAVRILEGEIPDPKTKDERRKEFIESLRPYVEQYGSSMVNNFYRYWAQDDGFKLRFEKQKSWNLVLRLFKWKQNQDEYERKAYIQQLTKRI
jgi:hypothetical protein